MFELHDLLIHLCLHLDKHFNGSHMQLYSWADIAHLLAQRGAEIDATELRQRCATYNAEKEVMKILGMAQSVFGAKLPDGLQLLPGKRVMVRAYHLKNDRWYWLWYPYRLWVGFKGFFWKKK